MIAWAWASPVVVTVEFVHGFFFGSYNLFHARRSLQIFGVIVYLLILVFQLFPIWILATFNTPRVKSAFGET